MLVWKVCENGRCRCVTLKDPFGHLWVLGQKHGKAMDSDEMKAGEKQWMSHYEGL